MKRKLETTDVGEIIKVPKTISSFGSSFRKKLKTENGINALKEFVLANKERDVVTEYINSGGSAKELVNLLKQFDGKKDLIIASTVLAALESVVVKAVDDLLLIQKNVEEACEELLCTYHITMQNMLCSLSSTANYKKIVLKLLTGMVTLSVVLAKKILTLFPINVKLLKVLTDPRAPSSKAKKLRTYFIHYLLSFLIDENVVLIAELLKIKGLLTSIVPGLMNDKPETVVLVLNTFRLKIVENIKISKTLKIHTFNTPTLRSLLKLYDYNLENEENNGSGENCLSNSVQPVRLAVHTLLLLLCTSFKKGILFRERNFVSGKSSNQLILTLLEDMNRPWKDDLKSQLVTEVLKVCPEFLKPTFNQLESYLQPSNSEDWKKLMLFLKQVIEKQEVTTETFIEQSTFAYVTSIFFPAVVQKLFRDHCDDVLHQNPTIRFQIFSLLEVCLRKISMFVNQCSPLLVGQLIVNALKDHIEQFLSKNSVSCGTLITLWNVDIDVSDHDECLDLSEYYSSLANVLLFYNSLCPISFNQLRMMEDTSLKEINFCVSKIQFKHAQLMYLISNPKPDQDQFSSLLKQFIYSYIENGNQVEDQVLENMFLTTGFFEGFEREVLIWMHCFRKVTVEHSSVISDLVVDVFIATSKRYKDFMVDVTLVACEDETMICERTDISANLESFLDTDEGLERIFKPNVLISPVMPALLSVLKSYEESGEKCAYNETIKLFVLRILVHLLHLQSNPYGLIALLEKYSSSYVDPRFFKHIRFWSTDKPKTKSFQYPLPDEETASQLASMLVIADCDIKLSSLLSDATETEYVLYWNLCTYYSLQLSNKKLLDSERCSRLKNTFLVLHDKLSPENKMHCLKFVITDLNFVNNFNLIGENGINSLFILLLEICLDFQQNNALSNSYFKLLSPYRQRIVLFLLNKQHRKEHIHLNLGEHTISDIIQFVMLSGRTATSLLNTICLLPIHLLVKDDATGLSDWCTVIQCLFQVAAKYLLHPMRNDSLLSLLDKIRKLLVSNLNVDELETGIIDYLRSFPHHISSIPEEIIMNLIEQHPTVDKLAVHLLPHYPSTTSAVLSKMDDCGGNMNVNELFETAQKLVPLCNYDHVLEIIRNHHLPLLISWIDGDCVWEMKYANLVAETFLKIEDEKFCPRLCKKIKSKWSTILLNVETFNVMKVIFENAAQMDEFVRLSVLRLVSLLSSSHENINWLCSSICDTIESVQNLNFLLVEDFWPNFIKSALKISLRTSNLILMRTLRLICDKALSKDDTTEINTIFQMTISHSEFVGTILSSSEIKCELIEFYLLLTSKNESLMSSNHVPLLLSAYNATLSKPDQLLLQVLQWYEVGKIRFSDCKPYLWGDAAVSHYSIRTEISVSLKRQPQPNQVLELLDINIVRNTIRHFLLDRPLRPGKEINLWNTDVYDLSFMLPLMSHLLAPESRFSVQKFTRSGALALVLVALSSQQSDVRMAAFHCLQRFQSHLNSREKEIQIWNHFMNALKNGILATQSEHDVDCTPPMLPCIVTNFLAQMSLIIGEPLHALYIQLTNFLLAKPSFDVNTIPNFLALFYSTDMKNRDHQEWMLSVIRDGMRCEQDWIAAQRCFFFKLLLQFYSSASSNEATNVLILEILCNAVKIPNCKAYLITKFGLLSWLNQIIQSSSDFNKKFLSCLINIFQSLKTVKNTGTVIFTIFTLLRKLHSKKVERLYVENLFEILSVLYCYNKTNVLTKHDFQFFIDFTMSYHSAEHDKICRNCLLYSSVVGLDECDSSVTNYLIRMIRRFLNNK